MTSLFFFCEQVVAFVPDVPALYELHFSVPMVGAVISALNTKLDTTMLASLLEELEAKMIFVYYEFIEVVLEALNMPSKRKDNPPQLVLIVDQYDQNSSSIVKKAPPGSLNYNELLAMGQADFEIIRPNNECDPISVNYTSGSTGAPKGEKYSHRATYHNSLKSIFSIDMRRMSVFLWTVDMFHCNGWCFTWAVAAIGGTNICLGSTLTAKLIFDAIFDHNVTHLCGAPNILNIIAESPACDRRKLPFKVDIFVAGASPTTQVLNKVVELGFNVRDGYGMTEALVPASVTPPELPIELAESVEAPNSSNGDGGDGGGGGGGGVEERRGPRFKDLGGMEAVIQALKMEVFLPLYRPELLRRLGIRPMSGILLHGPPGCGKTKLAHAIANETGVLFHKISATEIISCVYGNA
jgi:acyl-CoA synthetase (AMP-forming)/AMP-acid ligase II